MDIRSLELKFLRKAEKLRETRKTGRVGRLNMKRVLLILAVVMIGASAAAAQSQVKKSTVEGITNFAQVETTVACAGAVKSGSVAGIKKMGFASIINLRLANEPRAEIDAEAAAAKTAGINFVHLPFNGTSPDPAVADQFIKIITAPGN